MTYEQSEANGYFINSDGHVERDMNLEGEELTSLKGCPKAVEGYFLCSKNQLISLEFAPKIVAGTFDCSSNPITSLKGGPIKVTEDYNCVSTLITTLDGIAQTIKGDVICTGCVNLVSLWALRDISLHGRIVCSERLKYQIKLVNDLNLTEDEFAVQAYLGADDDRTRKYFADNYDSVAVLETIDEIF